MMGKRKYDSAMEKLEKKIKKIRKRVERYQPDSDNERDKEKDYHHSRGGSSRREFSQSPHEHSSEVISLNDHSSDSDILSIHSCGSLLERNWENIDNMLQTEVPEKTTKIQATLDIRKKKINNMQWSNYDSKDCQLPTCPPCGPKHSTKQKPPAKQSDIKIQATQDIRKKNINNMHQKWNAILQNGMSSEVRDFVMEKYEVPESCQLLTPPKLNEEVAAIIKANSLKRDEKIREKQAIIYTAISAIGHAIENMPTQDNNMHAMDILNDAALLLCDALHTDNILRRSFIVSCLNKDYKDMIETTVISKYLFGDNLQDKMPLNACQALRNKPPEELRFKPVQLWGSSNYDSKDCQLPTYPPSGPKHSTKQKPPAKQSDKIKYRGCQQRPIHPKGPKHTAKPKPARQSDNSLNFRSPLQPPIIRHSIPKPTARFNTYTLTPSSHSFKQSPQQRLWKDLTSYTD